MKVAIIGADGQLGYDLVRVFGSMAIPLLHADIEVTDEASIEAMFVKYQPDVVINTAAIVKVDWCETHKQQCFAVNADGQAKVARAAARHGAISIFISSDYVFDGTKKSFTEQDEAKPLNAYGESKAAGERATQESCSTYYIIRTSWLFGKNMPHKGRDFPRAILQQVEEGRPLKVINDRFGSPSFSFDVALRIKELIEKQAPYGIYHVTNSGVCSWYAFAEEVLRQRGLSQPITALSTDATNESVVYPHYSTLENEACARLGLDPLRPWQEALAQYFKEIEPK